MTGDGFSIGRVIPYACTLCTVLLSRVILAPLLLQIEADLGISHIGGGSLFLVVALGYAALMIASPWLTTRIRHRSAVLLASAANILGLTIVAVARDLRLVYPGLALIGIASGLYVPSGLASIYSLYTPRAWGKAIGIHEVGANLAFVAAPLLTQALSGFMSWRWILGCCAALCALVGGWYALRAPGGRFRSTGRGGQNVRAVLKNPSFAAAAVLFGLVLGAGVGGYSVLPVYLVAERGMGESAVNLLVALSRMSGLLVVFVAGWVGDRVNLKVALAVVVAGCGVSTALMGIGRGAAFVGGVFAQPVLTGAYFPLAFALLARILPEELRSVGVALVIPLGIVVGAGIMPQIMGILGEHGAFWVGYTGIGVLLLAGLGVFPLLSKAPR